MGATEANLNLMHILELHNIGVAKELRASIETLRQLRLNMVKNSLNITSITLAIDEMRTDLKIISS